MRRLFVPLLAAGFAVLLGALGARADTITLADGTRLDGKVLEETADTVVFEHKVGPALTRSTFQKVDVRKLEKSFGDPPPTPETQGRNAVAGEVGYPELATMKDRVMICLDRSGSMTIADRFAAAEDEVEKLVAAMPARLKFDIYLFDAKAQSLFEGETMTPTKDVKKTLRAKMDAVGVSFQGFTDLLAGLEPALERRPAAVYLFTDGVPTRGETQGQRVIDGAAALARKHKIPIHVVGVRGGTYTVQPEIENADGARAILSGIAAASGGKYREIEARSRALDAMRADPKTAGGEPTFTLYDGAQPIAQRELTFARFEVEILDPALVTGPVVMEYATDTGVEIRSLTSRGVVLDSLKPVAMHYKNGRLFTDWTIEVVRGMDTRGHADAARKLLLLQVPTAGGVVEIVYRRAGQEFKYSIVVPTPAPAPVGYVTPLTPPPAQKKKPGEKTAGG